MSREDREIISGQRPLQGAEPDGQPMSEASGRQRRVSMLNWVIGVGSVGAAIAAIVNVLLLFQTGAWQLLIVAAGEVLAVVCLVPAHRMARRGKLDAAGYWAIFGMMIAFGIGELAQTGLTLYLGAGGILMIFVVGAMVLPRKWGSWLALAGLFAAYFWLINRVEPVPRYDTGPLAILRYFVPLLIALLLLLALWRTVRAFRVANLRTRTMIVMLAATLIPVAAYGSVSSVLSYQSGKQRVIEQLESVAELKEDEIESWIRELHNELRTELSRGSTREPVSVVLQEDRSADLWQEAHRELQTEFLVLALQGQWFDELFLMDTQGRVILSTDETQEGRAYSQSEFFLEGLAGRHFTQPPLYSVSEGWAPMVIARPVFDRDGEVMGVLARRVSTAKLNGIMVKRAGLGQTGETYMVGADHVLLTALRSDERDIVVRSEGIDLAVGDSHINGSGLYDNSRGEAVVGNYRWLPELQVALIAEQNQSEAFQGVYAALGASLGVMVVFGFIAGFAALLISRSIAVPLSRLAGTAKQIAGGNLELMVEVGQVDEIGMLAQAFNDMTVQLRGLIGSLERRVAERTQALAHRSVQLETAARVSEAAGSILEPVELEQRVVELIRSRFDYYYVGLFLVDEAGEWAVLRAGTGEAGQQMLEGAHKLKVGGESMIGSCVAYGQARIALDVGAEAVRFDNPLLPETRSEMALPLLARGEVIGALTVQSEREAAFSQEDISILQTMVSQVANAIHNARLFEQTQAALSETATLYNASRRITEAGELQEIVTAVVDEIPVPDINRVVLWDLERDESGQVVAFIVRGGWHSGEGTSIMPVGTRLSTAQLPATRLVMRPEPLFFDNVQQDERIDPAARAMLRQQNIRGMGVLPLWSSGQQVGALLLESEVPHHFSESEIRPYRALSGQIAAAVENRRLFEENVRRAEELAALNRLAEVVSTSLEQQALLPSALETLLEVLDFEIGLFSLQDAESGRLLLAAQQGLPRSMAERFEREGMEGTLCDFVFRTREALCLGDVREEAPVDVRGLIEHGLLAYAGLPVLYKGECLGTICFFDTSVRHMSAADLLLLEDMGRQIGVGLENTRLFRQTQQALAEVEAARREAQEALAEAEAVHRRYLQREWRSFLTTSAAVQLQGFQAGPEGTKLLSDEQLFEGKDVERRRLAVPIKLRGQTIGLIDLTRDDEGEWSEGDQALVESFSENLALAIENTRLFEQTQHRAARERLTREITDKIRGQTDLGAILQTTVQELGKVLGTSQAAIRLGTEQELTSSPGGARSSKD